MAQRIKFSIIQSLFRLFSFLADKTNGLAVFVKPKILLGSVIIGLASTTPCYSRETKQESIIDDICYMPSIEIPLIDSNKVYQVSEVQIKPEFQGGFVELYKFIGQNLQYPMDMTENNAQGKVYVEFIIEKDGSVSNVKVKKSTGAVTTNGEKEAVRVIELMPNWMPGEQNGEKVRVVYLLPINYKLQ